MAKHSIDTRAEAPTYATEQPLHDQVRAADAVPILPTNGHPYPSVGAEPAPKKSRPKPDELTALRRIAAILETQEPGSRMRICWYLADYYVSEDAARQKALEEQPRLPPLEAKT